ncbi:hypothetical protein K437DRAFT_256815 [Tilletiaria anomala UBC 951]|uniref:START domain-containing protein n=1 Tax=Tilletiaria anomala (strain ATCC 24038 / CBS 436.72 / UBC 951) TaxID=1037660 RepID=A0A066W2E5_TILAU|nr:uncharacterized protein K437DRAFT_256815 [Tilletiaria anomala UBC 951]KDN44950.1 hypothetical protein K437DRAFT_256815 [Tilletiaria anomala UBC 951]
MRFSKVSNVALTSPGSASAPAPTSGAAALLLNEDAAASENGSGSAAPRLTARAQDLLLRFVHLVDPALAKEAERRGGGLAFACNCVAATQAPAQEDEMKAGGKKKLKEGAIEGDEWFGQRRCSACRLRSRAGAAHGANQPSSSPLSTGASTPQLLPIEDWTVLYSYSSSSLSSSSSANAKPDASSTEPHATDIVVRASSQERSEAPSAQSRDGTSSTGTTPTVKSLFSVSSTLVGVSVRQFWALMAHSGNRVLWDGTCEHGWTARWLGEELLQEQAGKDRARERAAAEALGARVEIYRMGGIFMVAKARDMTLLSVDARLPSSSAHPSESEQPLRLLSVSTSIEDPSYPPQKGYNRFQLNIGGFMVEELPPLQVPSSSSAPSSASSPSPSPMMTTLPRIKVTQVSDLGETAAWVPASIVRMVASTLVPRSLFTIARAAAALSVPRALAEKQAQAETAEEAQGGGGVLAGGVEELACEQQQQQQHAGKKIAGYWLRNRRFPGVLLPAWPLELASEAQCEEAKHTASASRVLGSVQLLATPACLDSAEEGDSTLTAPSALLDDEHASTHMSATDEDAGPSAGAGAMSNFTNHSLSTALLSLGHESHTFNDGDDGEDGNVFSSSSIPTSPLDGSSSSGDGSARGSLHCTSREVVTRFRSRSVVEYKSHHPRENGQDRQHQQQHQHERQRVRAKSVALSAVLPCLNPETSAEMVAKSVFESPFMPFRQFSSAVDNSLRSGGPFSHAQAFAPTSSSVTDASPVGLPACPLSPSAGGGSDHIASANAFNKRSAPSAANEHEDRERFKRALLEHHVTLHNSAGVVLNASKMQAEMLQREAGGGNKLFSAVPSSVTEDQNPKVEEWSETASRVLASNPEHVFEDDEGRSDLRNADRDDDDGDDSPPSEDSEDLAQMLAEALDAELPQGDLNALMNSGTLPPSRVGNGTRKRYTMQQAARMSILLLASADMMALSLAPGARQSIVSIDQAHTQAHQDDINVLPAPPYNEPIVSLDLELPRSTSAGGLSDPRRSVASVSSSYSYLFKGRMKQRSFSSSTMASSIAAPSTSNTNATAYSTPVTSSSEGSSLVTASPQRQDSANSMKTALGASTGTSVGGAKKQMPPGSDIEILRRMLIQQQQQQQKVQQQQSLGASFASTLAEAPYSLMLLGASIAWFSGFSSSSNDVVSSTLKPASPHSPSLLQSAGFAQPQQRRISRIPDEHSEARSISRRNYDCVSNSKLHPFPGSYNVKRFSSAAANATEKQKPRSILPRSPPQNPRMMEVDFPKALHQDLRDLDQGAQSL